MTIDKNGKNGKNDDDIDDHENVENLKKPKCGKQRIHSVFFLRMFFPDNLLLLRNSRRQATSNSLHSQEGGKVGSTGHDSLRGNMRQAAKNSPLAT